MKSPRIFDAGVVGLGIVAAMHNDGGSVAKPPRSDPIPIVSATSNPKKKKPRDVVVEEDEDVELSESYTRVTSRLGNTTMTTASAKKRVYSDRGNVLVASSSIVCWDHPPPAPPGLFFQSSSPVPPLLSSAEDFLNRCNLCRKSLDGCDIFMYRGEKAFCSVECRCQQIISEEHCAKCGSEVMKSFDYYVSPCLAPLHFAAGVAAA